jgi:serine phosphatase RsbU (regulator of sigma subunit)
MPLPPDATPTQLQEENQRLHRAVDELSILNELLAGLARAIASSLSSEDIMRTIVHQSLKAIHAEQGVITLVEPHDGDSMKTLVRTAVSSAQHSPYHFNQTLLGWMYLHKKPLMVLNPKTDGRFQGVAWDPSIRSLVCVPLMIKAELKGVLTVYNKKGLEHFTEDDQRLLAIIAAQSSQVVENARLHEAELDLEKMKEDVRLAYRIQTDLLPKEQPQIPGYDIAGSSKPAQVVGGDYFDFIPVDERRTALCLGDVSGKGLPASLLMANLQATLRGQTLGVNSARECIQRCNKLLYQSTSSEKFVTLFYGILDRERHALSFTNAGHENPFLFSAGGAANRLTEGGVVLSILEEFPYKEATVDFRPGDVLVIFSDGITEAINPAQELFGEARLAAVIGEHRTATAQEMIERIMGAVRAYAGTAPQMDDMTVVVVKRLLAS